MKNPIELIMVTDSNNNKFIRLKDLDNGTFLSEWGRVGGHTDSKIYPIHKWYSYINEKTKKGYRDVSDLKIEGVSGDFLFESTEVEHFYRTFSKYTRDNVGRNYSIATGAVTKAMIVEAQEVLNQLVKYPVIDEFNKHLLNLYTILPRKMSNVKDHLLKGGEDQEKLDKWISKEQDILDSLSSSVATNTIEPDTKFGESLGIEIGLETDPVNLKKIEDLINPTNSSQYKIYKVFKVTTKNRQQQFDSWLEKQDNKFVDLLIHGTRNPNCFSILKTGLLIRPTNAAAISGDVYGQGIYTSRHGDKSLGYTSQDSDRLLFLQEIHRGNFFTYKGWFTGNSFSLNYEELKKRGYDSTFVEASNGLRNSEYIVYKEEQANSRFLIWMK